MRTLCMLTGSCLLGAAMLAATTQAGSKIPTLQPTLTAWFDSPGLRLLHGCPVDAEQPVPITIRLRSPADLDKLEALRDAGVEIKRVGGHRLVLGDVACARATRTGLASLADQAWVVRVELDPPALSSPPLARTVPAVQAPAAWGQGTADGSLLTGKGIVVADLDSHLDVFHPALFRADGGYYPWLDADGDGSFEPGRDGVDLNGDGLLGEGEVLSLLDVTGHQLLEAAPAVASEAGAFEAGWDYLFLDQSGNGRRDFGAADFFGDAEPAFGEPLFAADDVDGDGLLDPDEKLVLLRSSKVRAVYDGEHTFARGIDLATLPAHELSWHGTCVTGILAGGTPGLTRFTGVAPDVELLFAINAVPGLTVGGLTDRLIWAVDQGADVVLQEIALLTMTQLDGSTNHERVMDEAAAAGVVMVNPAGNAGGAGKHGIASLPTGAQTDLPVTVPAAILTKQPQVFVLAVHWREPTRDLRFLLTAPGGEQVDLGNTGGRTSLSDGSTQIQATRDTSPRGTAMFRVQVYGYTLSNGLKPVPTGTWTLTVQDDPGLDPTAEALRLVLYASDDISGWGRGVFWPAHEAEDHLVGFPATADSALTVAAYAGRDEPGFGLGEAADVHRPEQEQAGQLRAYSSRGTRIDGAALIDLAAPDNPLAPVSRHKLDDGTVYGHGDLMVFGGTSGAGPHVAGAAALLKQSEPDLDGFAVRARLRAAALADDQVRGDDLHPVADLWGAGKLRIYPALFGGPSTPNQAPVLRGQESAGRPGQAVDLVLDLSDDQDGPEQLRVLWDDDYDGQWDGGPLPAHLPRRMTFDDPGRHVIKVQVTDTGGLTDTALLAVTVRPASPGGCDCASGTSPAGGLILLGLGLAIWIVRRRQPSPPPERPRVDIPHQF